MPVHTIYLFVFLPFNLITSLKITKLSPDEKVQLENKVQKLESGASVGVFLQVGNAELWPEMHSCLAAVASAQHNVDVYVSFVEGLAPSEHEQGNIKSSVLGLGPHVLLYTSLVPNVGEDMGQFLSQLQVAESNKKHYDLILKLHSKTSNELRNLGIQSLCGSKWQVAAILNNFNAQETLDMVVPTGTVFGVHTPLAQIAPAITERYSWQGTEPGQILFEGIKDQLKKLFDTIAPDLVSNDEQYAVTSGSMFWVRHDALRPKALVAANPMMQTLMTQGYAQDGGMEHALERFFPSMILATNRTISEMPPAPKVMAIFFPQYHSFPENDRFWGPGFTEWTLLKPYQAKQGQKIRKPLAVQDGGLGYYDLKEKNVRKRQAELARDHGVHGFVYYHYWFTGVNVSKSVVMGTIPELMLKDGEPSMPYFFSWANEPWTRHWNGVRGAGADLLIDQEYGNARDWQEHLEYLIPFFKDDKYMKIDGKPIFAIYRAGHVNHKLTPMMEVWRTLIQNHGFPGLYLVNTFNGFSVSDPPHKAGLFDAAFHFLSTCCAKEGHKAISTTADNPEERETQQFWGAFTGFHNQVRGGHFSFEVTPSEFHTSLLQSFSAMAADRLRRVPQNLFFIAAWNEWNEQNVLEPDDTYGFGFLEALRNALTGFQASTYVTSWPSATSKQHSKKKERKTKKN